MAEAPTPEMIARMHRFFAVECNNGSWDLIEKADRTEQDNRNMLYMAYSAAYHWSIVGTPLNGARADMLLSQVHSYLGEGNAALVYARRALNFCENNPCEDWDLAFAHAGLALAASVAGEADLHRRHYALAIQHGEAIQDEEDRRIFIESFAKISDRIK